MRLHGKNVVVTGAGSGIGRAAIRRFAAEEPRGLVACDLDAGPIEELAAEVGGLSVAADVGSEDGVLSAIEAAEAAYGPVDVFFSNAGVSGGEAGPETPDGVWTTLWNVNVMAHIWAARALVPGMLARGEGYLLSTASAAGLLMNLGFMPYTVTKHAALSVAECLATEYGEQGLRVSCLCPQAVATPMLEATAESMGGRSILAGAEVMDADQVAEIVVEAIDDERFLILTHPNTVDYARRRAEDHDRWIAGMRRLRNLSATPADASPPAAEKGQTTNG